jgi:hypothetical protein
MRKILFGLLLSSTLAFGQAYPPDTNKDVAVGFGQGLLTNICIAADQTLTTTGTIEEILVTCTIPGTTFPAAFAGVEIIATYTGAANINAKTGNIRFDGIAGTIVLQIDGDIDSADTYELSGFMTVGAGAGGVLSGSGTITQGAGATTTERMRVTGLTFASDIDVVFTGLTPVALGDITLTSYMVRLMTGVTGDSGGHWDGGVFTNPALAPAGGIEEASYGFADLPSAGTFLSGGSTVVIQSKGIVPDILTRSRLTLGSEFFSAQATHDTVDTRTVYTQGSAEGSAEMRLRQGVTADTENETELYMDPDAFFIRVEDTSVNESRFDMDENSTATFTMTDGAAVSTTVFGAATSTFSDPILAASGCFGATLAGYGFADEPELGVCRWTAGRLSFWIDSAGGDVESYLEDGTMAFNVNDGATDSIQILGTAPGGFPNIVIKAAETSGTEGNSLIRMNQGPTPSTDDYVQIQAGDGTLNSHVIVRPTFIEVTNPFQILDGVIGVPAYSFTTHPDAGMFYNTSSTRLELQNCGTSGSGDCGTSGLDRARLHLSQEEWQLSATEAVSIFKQANIRGTDSAAEMQVDITVSTSMTEQNVFLQTPTATTMTIDQDGTNETFNLTDALFNVTVAAAASEPSSFQLDSGGNDTGWTLTGTDGTFTGTFLSNTGDEEIVLSMADGGTDVGSLTLKDFSATMSVTDGTVTSSVVVLATQVNNSVNGVTTRRIGGALGGLLDNTLTDVVLFSFSTGHIGGTLHFSSGLVSGAAQRLQATYTYSCVNLSDVETCDIDLMAESIALSSGTHVCTPSFDTTLTNSVMLEVLCDSSTDAASSFSWFIDQVPSHNFTYQ